jgi:DNA-binding NarL/FixJ family response regulator
MGAIAELKDPRGWILAAATAVLNAGLGVSVPVAVAAGVVVLGVKVGAAVAWPHSRPGPTLASFTPREREVAALIAQGKTNKEIAGLLVPKVTERTVDRFVENILNKHDLHNRAEIAALYTRLTNQK